MEASSMQREQSDHSTDFEVKKGKRAHVTLERDVRKSVGLAEDQDWSTEPGVGIVRATIRIPLWNEGSPQPSTIENRPEQLDCLQAAIKPFDSLKYINTEDVLIAAAHIASKMDYPFMGKEPPPHIDEEKRLAFERISFALQQYDTGEWPKGKIEEKDGTVVLTPSAGRSVIVHQSGPAIQGKVPDMVVEVNYADAAHDPSILSAKSLAKWISDADCEVINNKYFPDKATKS